ncbi:MAG: DUF1684 domain-containing protein [Bacteroidia bacterium]|nr:DUF1684 domain-containing protein [Bacteroidia bacterium]
MKTRYSLLALLMWVGMMAQAQQSYVHQIQSERDSINHHFADTATSILPKGELDSFHGLHFYPPDTSFRIKARFKKSIGKPFEMQTSTARLPVYQRYGYLKFRINGTKCKLSVYENVKLREDTSYQGYVFCPFRDLSNTDSTYGGGRYLDFNIDELKAVTIVDFNQCYNPYCAYNNRYSCPVPPKENQLKVRIDAGVKKWHE